MKNPLVIHITFYILVSGTVIQAQNAIPASGGNASGSGGSVSFSTGQIVYTTNTGTNGSIAQGVQQPYEISVVTGMEETNMINLNLSAFPNPTTDFLILKVENYDNTNLSYQLFDSNGRLLENIKIKTNITSIVTSNLMPATYFLKVSDGTKEKIIFKIIKN
jgi:hypothetical protein